MTAVAPGSNTDVLRSTDIWSNALMNVTIWVDVEVSAFTFVVRRVRIDGKAMAFEIIWASAVWLQAHILGRAPLLVPIGVRVAIITFTFEAWWMSILLHTVSSG